ncbi:class I SAM-dependent methyltransferase [Paenibacillus pini]|uniref:Methyltransferase domain-containing protein n=1 Tax=Paenibacillus pini JCM 16418 TaxID=1236976 RepID=W7Z151_9BACL|nr:class I SAM-dependent methyltransferase [Paenibacillus pini]GAF08099.1 hypothetical protein JCM16418_2137 [Paenibacillus pini JCM 16418]
MEASKQNQEAWNTGAYEAWLNRFGTPQMAAAKLQLNPEKPIQHIYRHLNKQVQGKKIMNLMGSNGMKAVALSLLDAEVTVADFSAENEKYAMELAEAAGVNIRYIVADVLQLPEAELSQSYDIVFMENGILHYFKDLQPLFETVSKLLRKGGQLVLQDFHPVSTKLISSKGSTAKIRKHKVTGNYFDTALVEKEVAFHKFSDGEQGDPESYHVYLRNWTLGEIVTAVATEGLCIKVLEELPNLSSEVFDQGIPKTFTVVSEKL